LIDQPVNKRPERNQPAALGTRAISSRATFASACSPVLQFATPRVRARGEQLPDRIRYRTRCALDPDRATAKRSRNLGATLRQILGGRRMDSGPSALLR
jgi:hypothetical protein